VTDIVRIEPPVDNDERSRVARLLLDAADDPAQIRVVTDGIGFAFEVPAEVAGRVDLVVAESDDGPAGDALTDSVSDSVEPEPTTAAKPCKTAAKSKKGE